MLSVPPDSFKPPIREKPWWLSLKNSTLIVTFWGTIYAQKSDLHLLLYPQTPRDHGLLAHETVHAWRQFERGHIPWHWKYVTSKSFRWDEERIAYETEFSYLRTQGGISKYYTKESLLNLISGSAYNEMVSQSDCNSWLDKEFEK